MAAASPDTSRTTLVVTNDFPPRIGGIEGFTASVCDALDGDVCVLTRAESDTRAVRRADARLPYEVVRLAGPLLPTRQVGRVAAALLRSHHAVRVVFGAAAPLGLLAPTLRRGGAQIQLGLTHGHEVWWASVPGARSLLARIVAGLDHVGVISGYTETRIGAALPPEGRAKLVRIPPPVDLDRFAPTGDVPGPVVVAAGRLVRQKGFADLLDSWPRVTQQIPGAELRIVGDGPDRGKLTRLAAGLDGVTLAGPVPYRAMPQILREARVFALPVRTRFAGLNPEGLGRVFLEAAATGLPVVVGRSGGAPETVADGVTGSIVEPGDRQALASALVRWLSDPEAARTAGLAGRDRVATGYGTSVVSETVRRCLDVEVPRRRGER